MARKIFLFNLLLMACMSMRAQFKNDNVLYRLVYLQDLCQTMNENPDYLLLDVRSKGEYEDTSSSSVYNIGRFKDARNISIQELGTRLTEIKDYKDRPVFVYCSHSQRSRRASKMLADSGFTRVFNINSGFSSTHLYPASSIECILAKTESHTSYKILSPQDLVDKLKKNKNEVFLLDVRPDSIYNNRSANEKMNAYGIVKGSTHISRSSLETHLDQLPRNKQIVVIDAMGDESAKAASWLSDKGFKDVSILFNGIDAWITTARQDFPGKMDYLEQQVPFKILASSEFSSLIEAQPDHLFLDVRTSDEFNNQAKDSWRNIGQLKNAINIPAADFTADRSELQNFRNKPIFVYSFSGGEEIYRIARKLTDAGFKNVNVLAGGLFNLRWTAHNIKGKERIADVVVNVPETNL